MGKKVSGTILFICFIASFNPILIAKATPKCSYEYGKVRVDMLREDSDIEVTRSDFQDPIRGKQIRYWRTGRGIHDGMGEEKISELYSPHMLNLDELKGKNILDAGTGRGTFVYELRQAGAVATGIDLHITNAQKQAGFFVEGDMAQLPFSNNHFDFVYSTWSVFAYEPMNVGLLKAILHDFKRVLKVHGKVRISPLNSPYGMTSLEYLQKVFQPLVESIEGLKVIFHEDRTVWGRSVIAVEVEKISE